LAATAAIALFAATTANAAPEQRSRPEVQQATDTGIAREGEVITHIRQLTFEGRRSGEAYFGPQGRQLVFQSEREPGNPFFQIYRMDLSSGDIERISPGMGKTTCAWIHPDGRRVLFASTHQDPRSREKQREEIKLRASGRQRRYAWDYDPSFDIYVDRLGHPPAYQNLTRTKGYDAEGSWSPDGRSIVFASNRRAYDGSMTDRERQRFERDPANLIDIYRMDADGAHVRRLTTAVGYDGGPFFSPDGRRICWRHFSHDGVVAEIMTMRVDGSDHRQLTRLGAMSWAPFYHPSGEYLIFTTNLNGFANFELYLVDVAGKKTPVRVTYTGGFDGLPAFSPDGKRLAWTSARTADGQSQIFLADWKHARARQLLGITASRTAGLTVEAESDGTRTDRTPTDKTPVDAAAQTLRRTTADFTPQDIRRHVDYLCRPELAGRLTGTEGERRATAYVAAYLDHLGLRPAGDHGSWYQVFPFTAGVALGADNRLAWGDTQYQVDRDFRPLSFSANGKVAAAPVVFAGYGIVAPQAEGQQAYDSLAHLNVRDRWVLALRFLPEAIGDKRRQHLARYSSLRFKAMVARDHRARGLILVSGPNAHVRKQLVRLRFDGTLSGASIPVICVTDTVADRWLRQSGKSLKELQDTLDTGQMQPGFPIDSVRLTAHLDVRRIEKKGRNVLGRLQVGPEPSEQVVVVGAHVDHLGRGGVAGSLAREDEQDQIHPGADDNASGVAGMLEIAQYLTDLKAHGKFDGKRDLLLAAWSGEELGLIGSAYFAQQMAAEQTPLDDRDAAGQSIYPRIAACLNLDMVGRLRQRLILQGIGSSSIWRAEIERHNALVGLPLTLQPDTYLPTDASSFYLRGVPIVSAFTGSHAEYHTPRDTPDTLNYEGAADVARLIGLMARGLSMRETPPDYLAQQRPEKLGRRAQLRAYLGTIPDYAQTDVRGVRLSGVAGGGPADKAGIRAGDVIVQLAGKKIDNIYDYTYAIEAIKIGRTVPVAVLRGDRRLELKITPGSRD